MVNLQTGQYHGLNVSASRMFEVLEEVGSVREAARVIANEFEAPVERVEGDLAALCSSLYERGIIDVERP